jgi:hypothetical protein
MAGVAGDPWRGTWKPTASSMMVASPTAVRAVSHGVKLVTIGRMTPRPPMGSAMPIVPRVRA